MKQKFILIFCLLSLSILASDKGYFVIFKNKSASHTFNPYSYFDEKAIENKNLLGLPIYDWYDLPVNLNYVSEVAEILGFKTLVDIFKEAEANLDRYRNDVVWIFIEMVACTIVREKEEKEGKEEELVKVQMKEEEE